MARIKQTSEEGTEGAETVGIETVGSLPVVSEAVVSVPVAEPEAVPVALPLPGVRPLTLAEARALHPMHNYSHECVPQNAP